jgi:hypothetical protein
MIRALQMKQIDKDVEVPGWNRKRMIATFTCTVARELRNTLDNIALPCSVNA